MTLRCDGRPTRPLDLELATLGALIVRCSGALFIDAEDADALRACLAYAGVAAVAARPPDRDAAATPWIGRSLAPAALDAAVDAVRLRAVHPGPASAWVLRRRWLRRRPDARSRCAAVLQGLDAVVEWERRIWVPRSAPGRGDVRRVARPIVLDRDALVRPRPGPWALASSGAVTAWAFA